MIRAPSARNRSARRPASPAGPALAGLSLALLVASCAPVARRPGQIDVATLAARYERLRAQREQRLVAIRMEATIWVEGDFGRLPALQLDLALAGPDGVRARLASLFGTAFDGVVRGDSLRAYIPPRRLACELFSLEDSLGVHRPGEWACRTLAANWRPTESSWARAEGDSLWRAAWLEGQDSLALAVDVQGAPVEAELHTRAGRVLRVSYRGYEWAGGVAWPSRLVIEEGNGEVRVTWRMDRMRFLDAPDPSWMTLSIPASAERIEWSALHRALTRIGTR